MQQLLVVKATSIENSNDYEPRAVFFHVVCDPNCDPLKNIIIFGVDGSLEHASDCYPFVIRKDDTGDYGSATKGSERYFRTTFRSKRMMKGEIFSVTLPNPERTNRDIETIYRITEVTFVTGRPQ
jgi:hypothetical protein